MPRSILAPCALLAFALVAAAPAGAQQSARRHAVELTFAGGYFQPTGTLGFDAATNTALKRRPAWEAGGHLSLYPSNGWVGLDLSGGFSPERVLQYGAGFTVPRHTYLGYGAAQVLVGRSPRRSGISYMVGGGLGVMHRQKSVINPAVSTTDVGGVTSLMLRLPIDGQVALRLDAEDLIYSADFGLGKKVRNDFILTAGLSIAW